MQEHPASEVNKEWFLANQQRTRIPKKALHVNRYGTVPVANLFERKWAKKFADPEICSVADPESNYLYGYGPFHNDKK